MEDALYSTLAWDQFKAQKKHTLACVFLCLPKSYNLEEIRYLGA